MWLPQETHFIFAKLLQVCSSGKFQRGSVFVCVTVVVIGTFHLTQVVSTDSCSGGSASKMASLLTPLYYSVS